MTLGELIALLEKEPPAREFVPGFGAPHSYRGDYSELAFEPVERSTAHAMLEHARSCLGRVFTGYKGGEYHMTTFTDCWVADWGQWPGVPMGEYLMRAELEALRADRQALAERVREAARAKCADMRDDAARTFQAEESMGNRNKAALWFHYRDAAKACAREIERLDLAPLLEVPK